MNTKLFAVIGAAAASLTLSTSAFADSFHWSGDVNRGANISIQRDKVHIDKINGGSTSNEHSDFQGKLNEGTRRVRLVNYRGRGRVVLHQQPMASNNYTAVVSIRDRDRRGSGHYEFTLEWR